MGFKIKMKGGGGDPRDVPEERRRRNVRRHRQAKTKRPRLKSTEHSTGERSWKDRGRGRDNTTRV